jgi:hypothetical protein
VGQCPADLARAEQISNRNDFSVPRAGARAVGDAFPFAERLRNRRLCSAFIGHDWPSKWGLKMSTRTILIVVLLLLLLGALPTWPYSSGWGYYPSGGLGLILLIIIVLALF